MLRRRGIRLGRFRGSFEVMGMVREDEEEDGKGRDLIGNWSNGVMRIRH